MSTSYTRPPAREKRYSALSRAARHRQHGRQQESGDAEDPALALHLEPRRAHLRREPTRRRPRERLTDDPHADLEGVRDELERRTHEREQEAAAGPQRPT